jgi:hypothetical protein
MVFDKQSIVEKLRAMRVWQRILSVTLTVASRHLSVDLYEGDDVEQVVEAALDTFRAVVPVCQARSVCTSLAAPLLSHPIFDLC